MRIWGYCVLIYLINNGNAMRRGKGTFLIVQGKFLIELPESGKIINVKFPNNQEKIRAVEFTYPRAAIITARAVTKVCCKENGEISIKMSALALNVG